MCMLCVEYLLRFLIAFSGHVLEKGHYERQRGFACVQYQYKHIGREKKNRAFAAHITKNTNYPVIYLNVSTEKKNQQNRALAAHITKNTKLPCDFLNISIEEKNQQTNHRPLCSST